VAVTAETLFTVFLNCFKSHFLKPSHHSKQNFQTTFKEPLSSGKIKQLPQNHFICAENQTMLSDHTDSESKLQTPQIIH